MHISFDYDPGAMIAGSNGVIALIEFLNGSWEPWGTTNGQHNWDFEWLPSESQHIELDIPADRLTATTVRLMLQRNTGSLTGSTYCFIDNLVITQHQTEIVEENNYYPFGLRHNGYNDVQAGTQGGKFKYQGQERNDDLGLNWDSFKWRNYDYAIGRFMSIDPLAEDYVYNSPYAFAENKLGLGMELEGLELGKLFYDVMNSVVNLVDAKTKDSHIGQMYVGAMRTGLGATAEGIVDGVIKHDIKLVQDAVNVSSPQDVLDLSIEMNPAASGVRNMADTVGAALDGDPQAQGSLLEMAGMALLPGPKVTAVESEVAAGGWKGPVDYTVLKEPKNVASGKKFTAAQLRNAKKLNSEQNGGVLRSDMDGSVMDPSVQSKKGVPANMNQVEGDHINPKSRGGNNNNSNLQLINKRQNLDKTDN